MRHGPVPQGERGQVLPLAAAALVVILGVASLSVDVGFWRYQQRLEQTAADSAALAGAVASEYSASSSVITAAAQTDAASNGFTNNGTTITVTVNHPPLSGNYAGNSNAVEAIVSKSQPTFFAKLFGMQSDQVSARAVGLLSSGTRNCIYALNTDNQAITENGNTINMPKCGMISNGGLLFNQGTIDAASIGHAGSTITVNNTVFTGASPKGSIAAADPCGTISGCAYLKANPPSAGSCQSTTTFQGSGNVTLSPGTYCNQVIIENSGAVTFSPGLYYFENGITFNSGPTSVSGTGVTFYNPNNTFILDPNIPISFSAPTTGNYSGVLFYQPSTNNSQFHINSGSGTGAQGWQGLLYAPASNVILDGSLTNWVFVVAGDITLNSGAGVNDPNAQFPNNSRAVLAE